MALIGYNSTVNSLYLNNLAIKNSLSFEPLNAVTAQLTALQSNVTSLSNTLSRLQAEQSNNTAVWNSTVIQLNSLVQTLKSYRYSVVATTEANANNVIKPVAMYTAEMHDSVSRLFQAIKLRYLELPHTPIVAFDAAHFSHKNLVSLFSVFLFSFLCIVV